MKLKDLSKFKLPDHPGVYFFKKGKDILYIGKATSLRDRVRSYFSSDLIATRGPRMVDMVFKADDIEWIETDSVLEAMITEANLIKKHWPDYNVRDKDDKSFNYVIITGEDFPRVLIMRGRTLEVEKEKGLLKIKKTFGPFPSGPSLREALKIIRKMFPFADKSSLGRDKYHFYRQLGLMPDISSAEAKQDYANTIRHIILFFEGKKGQLIKELEREMRLHAKDMRFEKAADIKKKLFALDHIQDVALIKEDVESAQNKSTFSSKQGAFRIEAFDVAHFSGKESVGVMVVVEDGEVNKSEYRKFKLSADIGNNVAASLKEILERRLKHAEWPFPDLIVIDGGEAQINVANKVLAERGFGIPIMSVVKNERHKPKGLLGTSLITERYKKSALLANAEAHRFAIAYHRKLRRMNDQMRKRL